MPQTDDMAMEIVMKSTTMQNATMITATASDDLGVRKPLLTKHLHCRVLEAPVPQMADTAMEIVMTSTTMQNAIMMTEIAVLLLEADFLKSLFCCNDRLFDCK